MISSKIAGIIIGASIAIPIAVAPVQTIPGYIERLEGTAFPVISDYRWENVVQLLDGDLVADVYASKNRDCRPTGDSTVSMHAYLDDETHTRMEFSRLDRESAVDNPPGDGIYLGRWQFHLSRINQRLDLINRHAVGVFAVTTHDCHGLMYVRTIQDNMYIPNRMIHKPEQENQNEPPTRS